MAMSLADFGEVGSIPLVLRTSLNIKPYPALNFTLSNFLTFQIFGSYKLSKICIANDHVP